MSERTPAGEHEPFGDLSDFDGLTGSASRFTRKTIAGLAAGVVLLGAGAAGFFWVSSDPSVSVASAAPLPHSASTTQPSTGSVGESAVAFAASGRDLFANTVAPSTTAATAAGGGSGAASATGRSAGTSGTPGTSGSSSVKTTTSAGGTRTSSAATGTSTTAPSRATPTAPVPPSMSKPTPSRSTAPPWTKGVVTFEEIAGKTDGTARFTIASDRDPVDAYLAPGSFIPSTSTVYQPHGTTAERPLTDVEKTACETSVQNAATVEDAEKIKRVSKDCTVTNDFVWQAVFVPSSQASAAAAGTEKFGWIATPTSLLPDAALGKVSGTVRFLGQAGDKFLVQAGNAAPQWVVVNGKVEGTPLTFTGLGLDSIVRPDVAVFTDGTSQFFTVLGGGEGSGVTF